MKIKNRTMTNALICYTIIVVAFVIIRILTSSQFHVLDSIGEVWQYVLQAVAQIGLLLFLSIFLFKWLQKAKLKDVVTFFGFKKISWKGVLYAFLLGIIVYVFNYFIASFFSAVLTSLGYKYPPSSSGDSYPFWLFLINIVSTAILPAICEETAHRGMLMRGLSELGSKKAIIISSLLFGCMHMNIGQFFYTTIIGLFLGYVTTFTDNIYPAIIIHFMNNFLSVFMSFSRANGLGVDAIFTWMSSNFSANPIAVLIFMLALLLLLAIAGRFLLRALFKETAIKQMNSLQNAVMNEVIRDSFFSEIRMLTKNAVDLGQGNQLSIEQLIKDKSDDTGYNNDISRAVYEDYVRKKPSAVSKVLVICCFVLMGIVTFMTFIWGVWL